MKRKIICSTLSLLTITSTLLMSGCGKADSDLSYVTIETNPSVELVVNDENVVVAINGLNEDGKLLISGETIEGLKIDAAAEKIIRLTEELGFTVEGNATESSQEIKISISTDVESLKENLKNIITNSINDTIENLDLDAKIVQAETKTREYFENIVLKAFPELTEEEVAEMNLQDVFEKVEAATKEKAEFATVKLEEYYQTLKENEFKLKYKQELAEALESKSALLYGMYNTALEGLRTAIEELESYQANIFSDPESSYVTALNSLNDAKDETIGVRVELAAKKTDGANADVIDALDTLYGIKEDALNTCISALNGIESTIKSTLGTMISVLEKAYQALEALEATFPKDIDFEAKLTEAENYINNSKNELFAKFEASFEDGAIAQIRNEIATRKQELIDLVNEKKSTTE